MWHRNHVPSFHERFSGHAPVNRVVIDAQNQLLSGHISPFRKECLVERLKNLNGRIYTVDFGTNREQINDMEPIWVLHDCKHGRFALDIGTSFCCFLIFGHVTRAREKEKSGLITACQMSPTVFSHRF
jgi:hypothetical protein